MKCDLNVVDVHGCTAKRAHVRSSLKMAGVQRLLRRRNGNAVALGILDCSGFIIPSCVLELASKFKCLGSSTIQVAPSGFSSAQGKSGEGRSSYPALFSRNYDSLASARHFPWKGLRRNLFLSASPDHAAMQYLDAPDAGLVVISLNRTEARNAIGSEMLKQLHSILEGMRHASSARVLIVCSTVPGVFCAGADLKERRKMGISETEKFVSSLRATFSSLEALPIPTIAVIEGAALGGGLELALACDLRVCGDEAVFGLPETSLAIIPGAGGTQRLPRVIGRSRAKELIFTARRIDAQRAEAIGLVDHCVQGGGGYEKALTIAREILAQGPLAVKVAKHAIDHGSEMDQAKGMLFEEACYSRLLNSRDRLEGLAAFAEKRKPTYHGE